MAGGKIDSLPRNGAKVGFQLAGLVQVQQVFPGIIIAGIFGFRPSELFAITDAEERSVPNVDLSMKK